MSTDFKIINRVVLLAMLLTDVKLEVDTPSVPLPGNEDGPDVEIGLRQNLFPTYKQNGYTPQSACRDPNFLAGTCLPLLNCPGLLAVASNPKSPDYKKLQYSICGTLTNPQYFCCNVKQALTTPMPTPRQPVKTTKATSPSCDTSTALNYKGCGEVNQYSDRVVGGKSARKNSSPWITLILKFEQPVCGGSLITNQHVVTAAHCFVSGQGPSPINEYLLRFAEHDTSTTADGMSLDVSIAKLHVHEQYSPRTHANDIAIVKLKQVLCFSNRIRPACLPSSSWKSLDLTPFKPYVAGWGITENLDTSKTLLQATLSIFKTEECRANYSRLQSKKIAENIDETTLCAGDVTGKKDSCNGDSGGPLVLADPRSGKHHLIGIVSRGPSICGNANLPGIYVRVSAYFSWISDHVK